MFVGGNDLVQIVRQAYKDYIMTAPPEEVSSELREALKVHERIPLFVDNMARQIQIMEKRKGKHLKKWQIEWVVKDMVRIFIRGVELKKEKMYTSDVERRRRETEAQTIKDMRDLADAITGEGDETEEVQAQGQACTIDKQTIVIGDDERSKKFYIPGIRDSK
jgi:hypothetical protein